MDLYHTTVLVVEEPVQWTRSIAAPVVAAYVPSLNVHDLYTRFTMIANGQMPSRIHKKH